MRFFLYEEAVTIPTMPDPRARKILIFSLEKRMRARKSLGAGDSFANQIRFAYSAILRKLDKK